MKERTFIVLGASGFIGKHLTQHLAFNKKKVIAVSRKEILHKHPGVEYIKLDNYKDVGFCGRSTVFHLAETHHIKEVEEKGINYIKETTQLVEMLLKKKPERFIYASSTAVYDDVQIVPCTPDSPLPPGKSIYAQSKQLVEKIVLSHHGVVVRLTNTYGIGMSELNIFSSILSQLKSNKIVLNESSPVRDYIWVEDLVEGLYKVSLGNEAGIFNIASGYSISCASLCQLILEIADKAHLKVYFKLPTRKSSIYIDITKTQTIFTWHPKTTLEAGIKKLIGYQS